MEFWAEILFLDSSFNPLSIRTLDQEIELEKMILIIGLFYPLYTQTLVTYL